jgi:hypothetical protein
MNPIAEDNRSAEREPRLRAVPLDKFIDSVPVPSPGISGGQAVQDGGFSLVQVR